MSRIIAIYRVRASADAIETRAQAIAVEQSVEMPLAAIGDDKVLADIVGRVDAIADIGNGLFEVRVGLATSTIGRDAGQLINMLFGNSSLHEDVVLADAEFPDAVTAPFGGPRHGLAGLRRRCRAERRAMTCSVLKPQGLAPAALAGLAGRMAEGGIDFIKDDHGLADQTYSPFAERLRACAKAVRAANAASGHDSRYLPSLSGHLDDLRRQIRLAREEGVDTVLIAPMIVGLAAFHALVREFFDIAFMAHPAMAGAARIAPELLLGRLFRLLGADATIFPNHGGRFGYSAATCHALATAARASWVGLAPAAPVPAGGMTLDRVPEMLDFYGQDVILLIGGDLLASGDRLAQVAAEFARRVARHPSP